MNVAVGKRKKVTTYHREDDNKNIEMMQHFLSTKQKFFSARKLQISQLPEMLAAACTADS